MEENEIENDGIERGEDGRPMLNFPSMEKSESNVTRSHGGAEPQPKQDETDAFSYNPDIHQETANQRYAMDKLKSVWGGKTKQNIDIARLLLQSYADDDVLEDLETSGLGSHPDMIMAVIKAGERLAPEPTEGITGKGMKAISEEKLKERAREVLNKAIYDARAQIIAKHGSIDMV